MINILDEGKQGRNTRKRYKYRIRRINEYLKAKKNTLPQRTETANSDDPGVGDSMDDDKHMGLIQMYLQNPNGLGKSKYDAENMGALNDIDAL